MLAEPFGHNRPRETGLSECYLAPWIVNILPFSAQTAMLVVGVVEIVAAVAVAVKPRYAAYVVAVWLAAIVINCGQCAAVSARRCLGGS